MILKNIYSRISCEASLTQIGTRQVVLNCFTSMTPIPKFHILLLLFNLAPANFDCYPKMGKTFFYKHFLNLGQRECMYYLVLSERPFFSFATTTTRQRQRDNDNATTRQRNIASRTSQGPKKIVRPQCQ